MRSPIARGFGWGLLATLAMTAVMLAGLLSGVSPIPRPIPIALAAWVLGAVPQPVLAVTGMVAHFGYGGVAGAVFAAVLGRRTGLLTGLGFGVLLWLGMGLIFLPLLGWGLFGTAVTPRVALATLVLHLIYGAVLGWGSARGQRAGAQPASHGAA